MRDSAKSSFLRRFQMPLGFVAVVALAAAYALRPSEPLAGAGAPAAGWRAWVFAPTEWLADAGERLHQISETPEDIAALREQNAQLRAELAMTRSELARWRLGANQDREDRTRDFAREFEFIAADVKGADPSPRRSGALINRGSRHGVAADMPVLDAEGNLAGIVRRVGLDESVVQLANDAYFAVSGRARDGRWMALARGSGAGGAMRVEPLKPLARLPETELLVTSGAANSIYPAGIPVGWMRAGGSDKRGMREVLCEPAAFAEGKALEFVLVLSGQREIERGSVASETASTPSPDETLNLVEP